MTCLYNAVWILRPKSLKLVVVAFPLGAQDYGNSTMTGPASVRIMDWLSTG